MGIWLKNDLQNETVLSRLLWNTVSFALPFITHIILGTYLLLISSEIIISDYFFLLLIIPISLIVFSFINSKFFDVIIALSSFLLYIFSIFYHSEINYLLFIIIISNGILFSFGYLFVKLTTNWDRNFSKGRFILEQNLLFVFILISYTIILTLLNQNFEEININNSIFNLSFSQIYLLISSVSQFVYLLIQMFMTILITSEIFSITKKYREISTWSFDEKLIDEKFFSNNNHLIKLNRTVLIGDIRGYTNFSEKNDTLKVIHILNRYYEVAEEIILKYKGFKPEFIADEFITFFPNPETAIQCALELKKEVVKALQKYGLNIGIGLEEGEVIEGLVGGKFSKKYTLIGKAVNTASRYQNYSQNTEIIVSENIISKVKNVKAKYYKTVKIKGLKEEKILYNVLGIKKKEVVKNNSFIPNILKSLFL